MSSDNKGKNSNKISLIIIIVLTAVLIGVGGYIIGMRRGRSESAADTPASQGVTEASSEKTGDPSGEDKTKDEEKTTSQDSDDDKKSSDDTEEKKSEDSSSSSEGAIYVTVSGGAPWQTENGYGFQCNVKLQNDTDESYSGWEIQIEGFEGAKIEQIWNAQYKLDGDVIKLVPAEYNKDIAPHSGYGDIGMIVDFKTEAECKNIPKGGKLLVDGKVIAEADAAEKLKEKRKEEREAKREPRPVEEGTPFDNHGKLSVKGTDIVDKNGEKYQLRGVSTHGIAWFPDYVNRDGFQTLRDDWGANLIRIAMYTDENGGYCAGGNQDQLKKLVSTGVDYATELGMYVIIDWHVLHDLNPLKNKDEAEKFFEEMSSKYADNDNVIYEICNEPNGDTSWSDIKEYAEIIIPVIRKNDKDAIVIVGTPTWSQDVDKVIDDPIKGQDNVMYAVHFYAATHKENIRNKAKAAIDAGIPVFISEFSICDASGNGGIDYDSAEEWMDFINENNLSYSSWSLCNKDETSALISPDCKKTSAWTYDELSETGQWLKDTISSK